MDKTETSGNARIYAFDVMRIIAVCAVIMIHIAADFVKINQNNTFDFVCGNVLNSLSRFAAPMFFMISGALMLSERKKVPSKKHCIPRSIFWFCLWSGAFFTRLHIIS